jgi:hypothetical protein
MGSTPTEVMPETFDLPGTPKGPVNFSEEGVSVTVSPYIPESSAHAFTMYSPEQNTVTFSDKILIKGVNRYLSDVFVNNTKVTLRKDGRFFYEAPLSKIGTNTIWVSFISPDFKITSIPFVITRLKMVEGDNRPTSSYTLMANSRYLNTNTKQSFKTPLTREAFAEAMVTYRSHLPESKTTITDSKNPKISQAVDSGLMTQFPDGSFKPEQPIKIIDYIVGITRLLNLDIQKYKSVHLPYQDIVMDHWTTPYVQALYKEGLLPSSNTLVLTQALTLQTFTDLWVLLPGIKNELSDIYLNKETTFSEAAMRTAVSATVVHVNTLRSEIAKSRRLELFSPVEGATVYQPSITLRGRVFPLETIQVNHNKVTPAADGSFSVTVHLDKPGKHAIRLTSSFATLARIIDYTPGYSDMQGHWAEKTAAKFATAGWRFDNGSTLLPHKPVTRLELAQLLVKIRQPVIGTTHMTIKDVSTENIASVQKVVTEGWMNLHQERFLGNSLASKAEVAVVLRRAFALSPIENASPAFIDVPATHWAASDIAALVSANMLTPGGRFSPSRPITRAELLALLAKIPNVTSRLESLQL